MSWEELFERAEPYGIELEDIQSSFRERRSGE